MAYQYIANQPRNYCFFLSTGLREFLIRESRVHVQVRSLINARRIISARAISYVELQISVLQKGIYNYLVNVIKPRDGHRERYIAKLF